MNIFYLSAVPERAARFHCDQHVRKMIVEYAQLLSTVHRVFIGTPKKTTLNGRRYTYWLMPGEKVTRVLKPDGKEKFVSSLPLYLASHVGHVCGRWLRESADHYEWLYSLFVALCAEYTKRHGRIHATETKLLRVLAQPPKSLKSRGWRPPPKAMPIELHDFGSVRDCYREFYRTSKSRFATWTNRRVPFWYTPS